MLFYDKCTSVYLEVAMNKNNTKENDNYIGIEEASQYLGISVATLRSWLKQKDIPSHKVGKLWKFKRSELDTWINSGKSAE